MLPSASALASRREERVQKAFSVDHHEARDARLSHSATAVYGAKCDYVVIHWGADSEQLVQRYPPYPDSCLSKVNVWAMSSLLGVW